MNVLHTDLRSNLGERFLWSFSFKNRRVIVPILMVLILLSAIFLVQKFIMMDSKLKHLSKYEPMFVLSINRDLNIGDVIEDGDVEPVLFYKNEYNKRSFLDPLSKMVQPSLIKCDYDEKTKRMYGYKNIVGRVVNVPVQAGSLLHREYLAPQGTLPGLINLIEADHSLVDVVVPQVGFNTFIKPNDQVDLYETTRTGSRLVASKVKVILVNSQALGQAPLQVDVDPKLKRHLTIAVPREEFPRVARAKKNRALVVTYMNKSPELVFTEEPNSEPKVVYHKPPPKRIFQSLTMIQGRRKEIHSQ